MKQVEFTVGEAKYLVEALPEYNISQVRVLAWFWGIVQEISEEEAAHSLTWLSTAEALARREVDERGVDEGWQEPAILAFGDPVAGWVSEDSTRFTMVLYVDPEGKVRTSEEA